MFFKIMYLAGFVASIINLYNAANNTGWNLENIFNHFGWVLFCGVALVILFSDIFGYDLKFVKINKSTTGEEQ